MSRASQQSRVATLEARVSQASPPAGLQVHLLTDRELIALTEARRGCGQYGDAIGVAAETLGLHRDDLARRLAELRR